MSFKFEQKKFFLTIKASLIKFIKSPFLPEWFLYISLAQQIIYKNEIKIGVWAQGEVRFVFSIVKKGQIIAFLLSQFVQSAEWHQNQMEE